MIVEYFLYLAVGRLFIYLLRLFPLAVRILEKNKDTEKLLNCDLCIGVWIYTFLAWTMNIHIIQHSNVISYLVTGSVSSFIMYLLKRGWDQEFREYVIK